MKEVLGMPVESFIELMRSTASERKNVEDAATRNSMIAGQRVMFNGHLAVLSRMSVAGDHKKLADAVLECAVALGLSEDNVFLVKALANIKSERLRIESEDKQWFRRKFGFS